ncbi:tetratricopeptide repeat protein [Candidatus Bathyarchaeota archaeon]|nr:tetratricopeptide repeat protein [Candidatus Bathyarchaeota archaeon]
MMAGLGDRSVIPFQAYTGDDPYLFVSFSHADKGEVYPELLRLHNKGYRIWYDEGITPGKDWMEVIPHAIEKSSFFILFTSPNIIGSKYISREITYAIEIDKPFLAIFLEETTLPSKLKFQINVYQHLFKYELSLVEYNQKLMEVLPEATLDENIAKKPDIDPFAVLFDVALEVFDSGDHATAIMMFQRIVKLDPSNINAWINLSIAYSEQKWHQEAIEAARKAVELDQENPRAWMALGIAYFNKERSNVEAINAFRKALSFNSLRISERKEAWRKIGYACKRDGNWDDSIDAYKHAIKCDPDDGSSWLYLSRALEMIGRKQEAMAAYRKGVDLGW